jgi:hypothetical protein
VSQIVTPRFAIDCCLVPTQASGQWQNSVRMMPLVPEADNV